jgi:hypothetical protein
VKKKIKKRKKKKKKLCVHDMIALLSIKTLVYGHE